MLGRGLAQHHWGSHDEGVVTGRGTIGATLLSVSTFIELREQAEQEIGAHIRSTSSDSTHHFVVDSTNYFVEHGAVLLAAFRLWAEPRQKTDADLRALIDSANAATLETLPRSWPKAAILMNSMPACSLKALLTHLHASCTTHSTSHGRAFNRAEAGRFVPECGRRSSQRLESLDTGQIHNRPQRRHQWRSSH
jgi:hypothetical protein